jgi:hypothetical protein
MDRAEQRHTTATIIEIQDDEVQVAPSTADNLQRIGEASSDEHDCGCSKERFGYQLIESTIARAEKNQSRLHGVSLATVTWGRDVPLPNELEVSATSDAHLHCSLALLQNAECDVLTE